MEKTSDRGREEKTKEILHQSGEEHRLESESEARARTGRFQESLSLLQEQEPKLLQGLENCRMDRVPLTIYVEGYEHSAPTVLALLHCAHIYGVNLTIMPFPMRTVRDAAHPLRPTDGGEDD